MTALYYDSKGNKADTREESVAYRTNVEGKDFYYVKAYGGTLFNKDEINFSTRKFNWKFKQVNEKCFDLYIRFLKTKRKVLLHNAEREL